VLPIEDLMVGCVCIATTHGIYIYILQIYIYIHVQDVLVLQAKLITNQLNYIW
jgi:hypothetical protein